MSGGSVAKASHNYRADVQTVSAEGIDKAEHIEVIGDAEISSDLILFDISGIYSDNYLCVILKLYEHFYLTVGRKSRQNSGRMKIVKKLSAKLNIQLFAEEGYPLLYLL